MEKIKILLADDHIVLRSGLRMLINSHQEFEVIGEVDNGKKVLEAEETLKPDILLLDLSMPGMDGIKVIQNLRSHGRQVKILVLTMYEEEEYLRNVIQAGGNGYLLKKAAETELMTALNIVAAEGMFIDPALAGNMVRRIWSVDQVSVKEKQCLSSRENEVLKLVALGYTNRQIAKELVISTKTVESHKANIKAKLNISNRSELVRYAIERKVI